MILLKTHIPSITAQIHIVSVPGESLHFLPCNDRHRVVLAPWCSLRLQSCNNKEKKDRLTLEHCYHLTDDGNVDDVGFDFGDAASHAEISSLWSFHAFLIFLDGHTF